MSNVDTATVPEAIANLDPKVVTLEEVAAAMELEPSDYADDLKRIRAYALTFNGSETTLTDGQIAYLISSQNDDQDGETWAELVGDMEKELAGEEAEVEGDTDGTITIGASGIRESEHNLGMKLNNPEWKAFANANIEASDFMSQSAVRAALLIRSTYSPEELDGIPVFGSEAKNKEGKIVTNNPDVYLAPGKGKRKVIKHRVYDIVDDTLLSAKWAQIKKHEDAMGNVAGAERDLMNMGDDWNDTEIKQIKKQVGAVRRSFKDGLAILRKMQAVDTDLPNVNVTFAMDEKSNLRKGAYCIRIASKLNGNYVFQTYGSFLRMNIGKAKAKGGTMADLLATVGRGANVTAPAGGVKNTAVPKNADDFLNGAQALIQYLAHGEEGDIKKHILAVQEKMKGDGGKMTMLIIGRLFTALEDAFFDDEFKEAYYNLNRAEILAQRKIETTPLQDAADRAEKRSKLLAKAS